MQSVENLEVHAVECVDHQELNQISYPQNWCQKRVEDGAERRQIERSKREMEID